MDSALMNSFSRILRDKENEALLQEALEIDKLREEVVSRLSWLEENDNGDFWWEDEVLMDIFESLYKSGCIYLPRNDVEKLRWIALLSVEICKIEGFSYGNLIIPPDYLPDSEITLFEDRYGVSVIEAVVKLRKDLSSRGWDATLRK